MNKERTGRKMTRGMEGRKGGRERERRCCNPDDGRRGNEPTKGGIKKKTGGCDTGKCIDGGIWDWISYFIEASNN